MAFLQRLGQLRAPSDTYSVLPITGNVIGDVRLTTDTGDAYTWTNSEADGDLTDWKKITTSSFNDLTDAPSSTGLAIDDAVQMIEGLSVNIALLAFETLTGYGASIARMFDGQVTRLKPSDGGDDPYWMDEAESENYVQESDFILPYKNDLDVNTKSLIHGDGVQGSTSFVDLLKNTITSYGAITDTVVKKFGTGSIKFDGVNDYVDVSSLREFIPYEPATNDFCIDFWYYSAETGQQPIFCTYDEYAETYGAFTVEKTAAEKIHVAMTINSFEPETIEVTSSASISASTWTHVAIQIEDGYIQIWINGVLSGTAIDAIDSDFDGMSMIAYMYLGKDETNFLNGQIDEIRISSVARYTDTFTPMTRAYNSSTTPIPEPVVTDVTGKIITTHGAARLSGSNLLFGNASLYLDGVDSYLSLADSEDWNFPTVVDSYTKLLLHGNGTNGSQLIVDECGKTVTAVGNAQNSTSDSKFGTGSILFDGTGDGLTVPAGSDFDFGSGDFTIETWVKSNNYNKAQGLFVWQADGTHRVRFSLSTENRIQLNMNNGVKDTWYIANHSMTVGNWYHVALVRNGASMLLFVNGVLQTWSQIEDAIAVDTVFPTPTVPIEIGNQNTLGYSLTGRLDEFRVSKGIARYTSNFTPATSEFILSTYPSFTVDLWVSPLAITDNDTYIMGVDDSWKLTLDGTSNKYLKFSMVGGNSIIVPQTLSLTSWTHIAVVCNANVVKVYVNGVLGGSITASVLANTTTALTIGADSNGDHCFYGYMEEIRVSKGVARWTSAFTVPSESYSETYDSYTKLLLPLNVLVVENMTLQSIGYVSNYVPTSARIVVLEEDIDDVEENIELTAQVSRDGGTTWSDVNLSKDREFGDGTLNMFVGSVDVSEQPNGELMVWRVKTNNNVDCRLRGVSLYWR